MISGYIYIYIFVDEYDVVLHVDFRIYICIYIRGRIWYSITRWFQNIYIFVDKYDVVLHVDFRIYIYIFVDEYDVILHVDFKIYIYIRGWI